MKDQIIVGINNKGDDVYWTGKGWVPKEDEAIKYPEDKAKEKYDFIMAHDMMKPHLPAGFIKEIVIKDV